MQPEEKHKNGQRRHDETEPGRNALLVFGVAVVNKVQSGNQVNVWGKFKVTHNYSASSMVPLMRCEFTILKSLLKSMPSPKETPFGSVNLNFFSVKNHSFFWSK